MLTLSQFNILNIIDKNRRIGNFHLRKELNYESNDPKFLQIMKKLKEKEFIIIDYIEYKISDYITKEYMYTITEKGKIALLETRNHYL